ncbi:hypothetical protein GC207_11330 [bacterium]|nr:hypothetical protein [bacterium]
MEISEFAFRSLLLFLPGVIVAQIINAFAVIKKREPFFYIIEVLLFGLSCYLVEWFIFLWICPSLNLEFEWSLPTKMGFFENLLKQDSTISFPELIGACLIAIVSGVGSSALLNLGIPYRIGRKFRFTHKSGNLDVWGYAMNIQDKSGSWVTVRDPARDLAYDGWILGFSDDGVKAELYLRDVGVYRNSDGNLLYNIGAMYLDLERGKIALEFRSIPMTDELNPKSTEESNERETENDDGGQ